MAQRQKNKKPKVEEAPRVEPSAEPLDVADDALARTSDAPPADQDEDEDEDEAKGDEPAAESDGGEDKAAAAEGEALAEASGDAAEGDEGEPAAGQLGTERYVLAGFFAAGMLGAYVIGRAIQTAWVNFSNKDWFSQTFPRLASVPDDNKSTYGLILGGIIALVVVLRAYRRPDIRTWTDEVASELSKVKWPTRKEVSNSTMIVIAASAAATIYLALLDRLWAFVTNIVYGDGS
jgi:preprotein translocase subunit SecE